MQVRPQAVTRTSRRGLRRRQRLLLRTRYAPKASTAIMMPAAIPWSPGFGNRLKIGIMARRLHWGGEVSVVCRSSILLPLDGEEQRRQLNPTTPADAVAVDDGTCQGRLDIVLAENVEALALRLGKHMAI